MRLAAPAWVGAVLVLTLTACAAGPSDRLGAESGARPPVIDMHLHAGSASSQGPPPLGLCPGRGLWGAHDPAEDWGPAFLGMLKSPPCADPIWSPMTDEELRDQSLAELERLNVIAVLSGTREDVADWKSRAPERVIAGHQFQLGRDSYSAGEIAAYFQNGGFDVLAEVTNQYAGIAADDPRFEAYWRIAEENDIPVGVHIGAGPPGTGLLIPGYPARLHSPLQLESVLARHPKLRVYVMHAGWPMGDDMIAMLYVYPQLYVDTGVLQLAIPRDAYYAYLEDIVRAGFHERILFGSDQLVWPGAIEEGIRAIEEAPFLTEQQKRDILYNNAARFLRFSEEEIARHHAPAGPP